MPKISIIMPVYNCKDYVAKSIESVINQKFTSWEFIIVDDGSTDGSGEICDTYASNDARIKVIHLDNGGVSQARNKGLENATGEYIQFLDSDDMILPQTMQVAIDNIENNDMVIWGYEIFPVAGKNHTDSPKTYKSPSEMSSDFNTLSQYGLINTPWNKLFRRKIIEENGLIFDKKISYGEDALFNLSYFKHCGGVKVIPDVLHKYRYDSNSTNSLSGKFHENMMYIQQLIKEECDSIFCGDDNVKKWTRKIYLGYALHQMFVCSINSNFTKKQRVRKIKSYMNDDYFRRQWNERQKNFSIRDCGVNILVQTRSAYIMYLTCRIRCFFKKLSVK